jgi:microcystin degradation protein MlrC
MRIAVATFQHETNTFAPSPATWQMFEQGGGWPGVCFGDAVVEAVSGANIPLTGFMDAARSAGHSLVPLAFAAASPSNHVTSDAFERITGEMVARLKAAMPVDAVYLDLHGAMVAEEHDDGEGEILRRVRAVVGTRVPLVISLDLHSNTSQAMFAQADAMIAYQTYPHVDMAATGARAYLALMRTLQHGNPLHKAMRTFDFLTGINSQCSLIEPAKGIYTTLGELETKHDVFLSFTPGFPMADIADCGMAIFGYATDPRALDRAMAELHARVAGAEREFALDLLEPDAAVKRAMQSGEIGRPTVIADTQDNPGAGGNGDTTGMLAALIRQRAEDAVMCLLVDGDAARKAHEMGVSGTSHFSLGGRSRIFGDAPFEGEFSVEALGSGQFTCTGKMFTGYRMNLGPMALLRSKTAPGVRVVLATRKCQAADQDMFRHVGVEPARSRLLVLKSSVHFRADFQPIAKEVLVARAAGPALADPTDFKWTKLRKGLRIKPLGPVFAGA